LPRCFRIVHGSWGIKEVKAVFFNFLDATEMLAEEIADVVESGTKPHSVTRYRAAGWGMIFFKKSFWRNCAEQV